MKQSNSYKKSILQLNNIKLLSLDDLYECLCITPDFCNLLVFNFENHTRLLSWIRELKGTEAKNLFESCISFYKDSGTSIVRSVILRLVNPEHPIIFRNDSFELWQNDPETPSSENNRNVAEQFERNILQFVEYLNTVFWDSSKEEISHVFFELEFTMRQLLTHTSIPELAAAIEKKLKKLPGDAQSDSPLNSADLCFKASSLLHSDSWQIAIIQWICQYIPDRGFCTLENTYLADEEDVALYFAQSPVRFDNPRMKIERNAFFQNLDFEFHDSIGIKTFLFMTLKNRVQYSIKFFDLGIYAPGYTQHESISGSCIKEIQLEMQSGEAYCCYCIEMNLDDHFLRNQIHLHVSKELPKDFLFVDGETIQSGIEPSFILCQITHNTDVPQDRIALDSITEFTSSAEQVYSKRKTALNIKVLQKNLTSFFDFLTLYSGVLVFSWILAVLLSIIIFPTAWAERFSKLSILFWLQKDFQFNITIPMVVFAVYVFVRTHIERKSSQYKYTRLSIRLLLILVPFIFIAIPTLSWAVSLLIQLFDFRMSFSMIFVLLTAVTGILYLLTWLWLLGRSYHKHIRKTHGPIVAIAMISMAYVFTTWNLYRVEKPKYRDMKSMHRVQMVKVNRSKTLVRKESTSDASIVGYADIDETYQVIERKGEWYSIVYHDQIGYIHHTLADSLQFWSYTQDKEPIPE